MKNYLRCSPGLLIVSVQKCIPAPPFLFSRPLHHVAEAIERSCFPLPWHYSLHGFLLCCKRNVRSSFLAWTSSNYLSCSSRLLSNRRRVPSSWILNCGVFRSANSGLRIRAVGTWASETFEPFQQNPVETAISHI